MNVGICYALADKQIWLRIDVPENSTIAEVINLSGIKDQFPDIDLQTQKVGVFGKITKLDTVVKDGERVEIYRKITADPNQVQRRRVAAD